MSKTNPYIKIPQGKKKTAGAKTELRINLPAHFSAEN